MFWRRKLTLEDIMGDKNTRFSERMMSDGITGRDELIQFVVQHFEERAKNPVLIEDVRFSSGEMVENARCHGNRGDDSKKINVFCLWRGRRFYFVVQDEGEGFDIDNPVYHASPPDGGLGIAYTRDAMSLVYNFGDSASYCYIKV